jgi:hypothetical protein
MQVWSKHTHTFYVSVLFQAGSFALLLAPPFYQYTSEAVGVVRGYQESIQLSGAYATSQTS